MVVRAGREFLAIPGPTNMPDEVLRAMHRPALDIYSEQMVELTDSLLRDLSKLFATKDRKSTRLNSSHQIISYAVFCLKKKKDPHRDRGVAHRGIVPRPGRAHGRSSPVRGV